MPLFLTGGHKPELGGLSLPAIDGNGRRVAVHLGLNTFNTFTDKIIQAAASRNYDQGAIYEEGGETIVHVHSEDCREVR